MKPPWPPICPTTGFIYPFCPNFRFHICLLCQTTSIILASSSKLCILLVCFQSLGVNTAFTCSRRCHFPGTEIDRNLNNQSQNMWSQNKGLVDLVLSQTSTSKTIFCPDMCRVILPRLLAPQLSGGHIPLSRNLDSWISVPQEEVASRCLFD